MVPFYFSPFLLYFCMLLQSYGSNNAAIVFIFRAPSTDSVLVIQTPLGTFATKSMLKKKEKRPGSRLISSKRPVVDSSLQTDEAELEPEHAESSGAARCRTYKKVGNKVEDQIGIC